MELLCVFSAALALNLIREVSTLTVQIKNLRQDIKTVKERLLTGQGSADPDIPLPESVRLPLESKDSIDSHQQRTWFPTVRRARC